MYKCHCFRVLKKKCIMSTGLSRPRLARSAHLQRINLLRGYVSKSSPGLNLLTITQLVCERPRGRSLTALRGPAHQLAVRMRIIIKNNERHAQLLAHGAWLGCLGHNYYYAIGAIINTHVNR